MKSDNKISMVRGSLRWMPCIYNLPLVGGKGVAVMGGGGSGLLGGGTGGVVGLSTGLALVSLVAS